MKRLLLLPVLFMFGCSSDDIVCTQKVFKKDGAKWILINDSSWNGPDQYKNYTRTIRYEDGSFDVIKTIVTCE